MKPEDLFVGKTYHLTQECLNKYNDKNNFVSRHIDNVVKLIYVGKSTTNHNYHIFNKIAFGYFVDRAYLNNDDLNSLEPSDDYLL